MLWKTRKTATGTTCSVSHRNDPLGDMQKLLRFGKQANQE